jgi:hypothetical protein
VKKQLLIIAGLLALLASASPVARAVPQASSDQDTTRKAPTPDEVVSMLDSKLSLSADQKAKITPIIADRQQKIRALAADQSTRRFKKAREMKSIFEDSDKKIEAVLNDEQKQKYSEIKQELRAEVKQRRQERAEGGSSH